MNESVVPSSWLRRKRARLGKLLESLLQRSTEKQPPGTLIGERHFQYLASLRVCGLCWLGLLGSWPAAVVLAGVYLAIWKWAAVDWRGYAYLVLGADTAMAALLGWRSHSPWVWLAPSISAAELLPARHGVVLIAAFGMCAAGGWRAEALAAAGITVVLGGLTLVRALVHKQYREYESVRRKELEMLSQLPKTLASIWRESDPEKSLRDILGRLRALLGTEAVGLRLAPLYGEARRYLAGDAVFPMMDPLVDRLLQKWRQEAKREYLRVESLKAELGIEPDGSAVFFPLLVRDAVVGVLWAAERRQGQYRESSQRFVEAFATELQDSLDQATFIRVLESLQGHADKVLRFHEDLEEFLRLLTVDVGFEFAAGIFVDQAGRRVRMERGMNIEREWVEAVDYSLDDEDIVLQALRGEEPLERRGHHVQLETPMFHRFNHDEFNRVWCGLRRSDGAAIGVVEVGYRDGREFTDRQRTELLRLAKLYGPRLADERPLEVLREALDLVLGYIGVDAAGLRVFIGERQVMGTTSSGLPAGFQAKFPPRKNGLGFWAMDNRRWKVLEGLEFQIQRPDLYEEGIRAMAALPFFQRLGDQELRGIVYFHQKGAAGFGSETMALGQVLVNQIGGLVGLILLLQEQSRKVEATAFQFTMRARLFGLGAVPLGSQAFVLEYLRALQPLFQADAVVFVSAQRETEATTVGLALPDLEKLCSRVRDESDEALFNLEQDGTRTDWVPKDWRSLSIVAVRSNMGSTLGHVLVAHRTERTLSTAERSDLLRLAARLARVIESFQPAALEGLESVLDETALDLSDVIRSSRLEQPAGGYLLLAGRAGVVERYSFPGDVEPATDEDRTLVEVARNASVDDETVAGSARALVVNKEPDGLDLIVCPIGTALSPELRALARPLAGGLRSYRVYERMRRRIRPWRALVEIGQRLRDPGLDNEARLRIVLTGVTAREGLGFSRAFILVDDGGGLRTRLAAGEADIARARASWEAIRKRHAGIGSYSARLRELLDKAAGSTDGYCEELNERLRGQFVSPQSRVVTHSAEGAVVLSGADQDEWRVLAGVEKAAPFAIAPIHHFGKRSGALVVDNRFLPAEGWIDPEVLPALAEFAALAAPALAPETFGRAVDKSTELLSKMAQERTADSERLNRFYRNVAHQLRNPLRGARDVLEVLRDQINATDLREHTELALAHVTRAVNVVARLRTMLEIVEGEFRMQRILPVRVPQLVALVAKQVGLQSRLRPKVRLDPPVRLCSDDTVISADEYLVEEVFSELLSNAQRYASDNSVVEVAFREEGRSLVVEFKNQGIPLKQADWERCFEYGWRSDVARSVSTEGLGLGLWYARRIMESLGGSVDVREGDEGIVRIACVFPVRRDS